MKGTPISERPIVENDCPLVTVVVLNWNGWRDTAECLRSLRSITYPKAKIVVVDNGSTDDSVVRLREQFRDVKILETGANLGFGGGNNAGIRYALGNGSTYVWLLNNDAVAHADALAALVQVAETDRRLGAVGSILRRMDRPMEVQVWGGGRVNLWLGFSRHCPDIACAARLDYVFGASMLLRADALRDAGLFDEQYYFMLWEDTDMCFRLRRRGWRLGVAQDSILWHKESASLGRNLVALDTHFNTSAARFFRRHSPFPLLPVAIGTSGRFLKRVLRGEWNRAGAVLRGARAGLFGRLPERDLMA